MANSPVATKNRPYQAKINGVNAESSAAIAIGNPVALSGAGLAAGNGNVVLPSTAGATGSTPLFAGIAASNANVGQPVEIICGGYVNTAKFIIRTRAASTDSWSTVQTVAANVLCSIDTVNNGIASSAAGAASLAAPAIVLLESRASIAGVASSTSDSATVSTTTVKALVRALF